MKEMIDDDIGTEQEARDLVGTRILPIPRGMGGTKASNEEHTRQQSKERLNDKLRHH